MRNIVNGILEIFRTGIHWRNVKHTELSWQVLYYYFRKWERQGAFERLNSELNKQEHKRQVKMKLQVCYVLIANLLN